MRYIIFSLSIILAGLFTTDAAELTSLSWSQVCNGAMDAEWYGSDEAVAIADTLLATQKNTGGWMKNYEYHKLTADELSGLKLTRSANSCLDNNATIQEMKYLCRVWQKTGIERFHTSVMRGLNLLFVCQKKCGGWSQFWPLYRNGQYHDFITFNDDLMTNVMRFLHEVHQNKGIYAGVADADMRQRCKEALNRALELTLKCQVDDNGVKSGWCAQHDTIDLMPAVGRPFELPTISGYESAQLLAFLMTLPRPSLELREAITAGVTWLDNHKIEGKAVEKYIDDDGMPNARLVDKAGSSVWGRFIQLGGASGEAVYNKFLDWLRRRGKTHSYTYNGVKYTYTEVEAVKASYKPEMAYQPVFGIYDDRYPHMYYRYVYNYEDTEPEIDGKGCMILTSLMPENRYNYNFMDSRAQEVIEVKYPEWLSRTAIFHHESGARDYLLSADTYQSDDAATYTFEDGFSITNTGGKAWAEGRNATVKYSANVRYTIHIPAGLRAVAIRFYGYDNYPDDAYIKSLGQATFTASEYAFPGKVDDTMTYVTHTFDFPDNPLTGAVDFSIGVKQCCLQIVLFCEPDPACLPTAIMNNDACRVRKEFRDGQVVITTGSAVYSVAGRKLRTMDSL